MRVIGGLVGPVRTYSRRQWLRRGLLAAPFAVCLLLALVLGPARIDSRYGSFGWLVVGSASIVSSRVGGREVSPAGT